MDSKLQIISGQYRGRKLRLPPDARPTQNRARAALFNMLGGGILDSSDAELNIWDAFGGSGAFGIECISRYPNAFVTFTDTNPTSIKTIRDNLAALSVGARASVVHGDAIARVSKIAKTADILFIDAPYDLYELGAAFVRKLGDVAKSGAIVIWEQEVSHQFQPDDTKWNILRDKTYGRARFLIMKKI